MVLLGALVPPLHLQPRRSRRKTWLPSLVLVWLVPKALTGSMLEKEPPRRFHGTLCASGPCHPADTGHSLDEEGQILVGMTCSASSSSGVSVRGARLSCQRGQGWPGLCLLTAGLADLKDLFQPEQFCDSRTLWSKGPR